MSDSFTSTYSSDYKIPKTVISLILMDVLKVLTGSLLLALCSQIRFTLPFTPIPITAQTLAVLLLPTLMRGWRGPAAVALYIIEGILGLPVYQGLNSGLSYLFLHSGGYILGFFIASIVIVVLKSLLSKSKLKSHYARIFISMLAGNIVIYLFGVPWLAKVMGVGFLIAIAKGMTPFLLGDLIKLITAVVIVPETDKRH